MNEMREVQATNIRLDVRERPEDEASDYVFEGREVARVTSRKTASIFWTEIAAYETTGGQIVVHTKGCALDPEKATFHKVMIFKDDDEMMLKMGVTGMHRRLWRRMGITEFVIA